MDHFSRNKFLIQLFIQTFPNIWPFTKKTKVERLYTYFKLEWTKANNFFGWIECFFCRVQLHKQM